MSKITIYTTPTCVYCKMTKAFFKEKNVTYEERDVSVDAEARDEMIAKSNQMGVPVILGSTRPNRFSDKPGNWIFEAAKKKDSVEAELLDLRSFPLPFFDEPTSPAMVKDGAYSNDIAKKWAAKIREADAFIIVTPEYNHGTSGVLKNALDYVYAEWNNKPVGFVSYGGVGGARAIEQLRGVAVELQMAPIRSAVHIPQHWNLLDENGELKTGALDPFKKTADAFLDQLLWWAKALKIAREQLIL